jgi:hypothetical protein
MIHEEPQVIHPMQNNEPEIIHHIHEHPDIMHHQPEDPIHDLPLVPYQEPSHDNGSMASMDDAMRKQPITMETLMLQNEFSIACISMASNTNLAAWDHKNMGIHYQIHNHIDTNKLLQTMQMTHMSLNNLLPLFFFIGVPEYIRKEPEYWDMNVIIELSMRALAEYSYRSQDTHSFMNMWMFMVRAKIIQTRELLLYNINSAWHHKAPSTGTMKQFLQEHNLSKNHYRNVEKIFFGRMLQMSVSRGNP